MSTTITTQTKATAIVVHASTPREATEQVRKALPLLRLRNLTAKRTSNSTFEVWA